MFRSERMVKLRISAPKSQYYPVLNKLYELGLYHVAKPELELESGEPLEDGDEISASLVQVRSVIAKLDVQGNAKANGPFSKKTFAKDKKVIDKLYDDVTEADAGIKSADRETQQLAQKLEILNLLKQFGVKPDLLLESKRLGFLLGKVKKSEGLEDAIKAVTDKFSLKIDGDSIFIVFTKTEQEKIINLLSNFEFSAYTVVDVKDFTKEIESIKKQLSSLNDKKKQHSDFLKRSKMEYKKLLLNNEFLLEEEAKKLELPLSFVVTKKAFFAEGWIPTGKIDAVQSAISDITKAKVSFRTQDPGKKDDVPIKMKHTNAVDPFSFLTRLYELPTYKEFDPTLLIFLTFPLFFGFMLGDVGYGLVLLAGFWYLKKKVPVAKSMATILMWAAVVTMIFGVGFGEYFGFEYLGYAEGEWLCDNVNVCLHQETILHNGHSGIVWDIPRLLNRPHSHMNVFGYEVLSVLVIGAIVGFVHLNLGLLIGFINIWIDHGFKMAFLEKISWYIMQAGVVLLIYLVACSVKH